MRQAQSKKKSRARARKSEKTDPDDRWSYAGALDEGHFGARILDRDNLISGDGLYGRITVNNLFGVFIFDYDLPVETVRAGQIIHVKKPGSKMFRVEDSCVLPFGIGIRLRLSYSSGSRVSL